MLSFSNIKNQLQLAFFGLIALVTIGGGVAYHVLRSVQSYHEVRIMAKELQVQLEAARKAETGFLLHDARSTAFHDTGKGIHFSAHLHALGAVDSLLGVLSQSDAIRASALEQRLTELQFQVQEYGGQFEKLAYLTRKRGFEDFGAEGAMRKAAHELEQSAAVSEQASLLMLRRHEKDFFLRKDLKYRQKFDAQLADIQAYYYSLAPAQPQAVAAKLRLLEAYKASFHEITALEQQIGLGSDMGILAELDKAAGRVSPMVAALAAQMDEMGAQGTRSAVALLIGVFVLLVGCGVGFHFYVRGAVTKPMVLLNRSVLGFIQGEKEVENVLSKLKMRNEIGQLATNFRTMLGQIQTQMEEISRKNEQLETAAAQERERNWIANGLARFNELASRSGGLEGLSHDVLVELVKYTNSAQGGLYLAEDAPEGQTLLRRAASYAYGRKKFVEDVVKAGEGLVGAAYLEKETIFMTDLPEDYLQITSGLGDAKPRCLLVVPIRNEGQVEGVIELASLHSFTEAERELLDRVAERLAGFLSGMKNHDRTQRLLAESQMMTERLRAGEEELRQNLEELEATQEEMHRLSQESAAQLEACQAQLAVFAKVVEADYQGVALLDEQFQLVSGNRFVNQQLMGDTFAEWDTFLRRQVRVHTAKQQLRFVAALPLGTHDKMPFEVEIHTTLDQERPFHLVLFKIGEMAIV